MNEKILAMIERGRILAEEKREEEEREIRANIQGAKESWRIWSAELRRRLPLVLNEFMMPLKAPESELAKRAPNKIGNYELAWLQIPTLAPIQAKFYANGAVNFQLPSIDEWMSEEDHKPRFVFGKLASDEYTTDHLPELLFDAKILQDDFEERTAIYETQSARLAERRADPEYVELADKKSLTAGEILIDDLRGIIREIVREELETA
jgi:hypothetical protein